jgi:hypothetical protein
MTLPRKRNINATLIGIALIGGYFYLWNHYALNIPKWDDHVFKATILNYHSADSFGQKLYELHRQHNEHRLGLTRLVALIDFGLFGSLNYKHLMLFGNLALLLIAWLLIRFFRQTVAPVWYALPVVSLWFSLAFWENTFWGMAAIQNFWVVAFAMLTFWILSKLDKYWGWAILAGFCATFTSGNGLIIWPISLFVLLLQRRWLPAICWFLATAAVVLLYFYDYVQPPAGISAATITVGQWVRAFVLFSGALMEGVSIGNDPYQMPLWMGRLNLFVSVCLLLYLVRSYWKRHFELTTNDYFYLGCVLFALATALLVVYSRAGGNVYGLLTSRYKVYSALLLSLNVAYLTLLVSERFFRETLHVTFLVGATFVYVCNQHYHLYDTIMLRKFMVTSCLNDDLSVVPTVQGKPIYNAPRLFTDHLPAPTAATVAATNCPLKTQNGSALLQLERPQYRLRDMRDGGLYLFLENTVTKKRYLFPTQQARKHSFRNLLNYDRFFIKGSIAQVTDAEVKPGTYRVLWLHYVQDKFTFQSAACSQVTFVKNTKKEVKTNW